MFTKNAYVYSLNPTDDFSLFYDAEEYLKEYTDDKFGICDKKNIIKTIEYAKELFSKHTIWEGDGNVYLAGLPGDNCDTTPCKLVIIKQNNNGCTFLYSPVELPYLEEFLEKKIIEE